MRLFFSLGLGFLGYLILVFLYGESGIFAYKKLCDYQTQLEQHIENLEENISSLEKKLASLYYSKEDIVSKLRDLNYFKENDHVIFLPFNLTPKEDNRNIRKLEFLHKNPFTSSFFWISFVLLSFFFYTLWNLLRELVIGIPYVIFHIKNTITKTMQLLKFYLRRKS